MADTQKEIDNNILQAEEAFREQAYDKAIIILDSIIRKYPDHTPAYRKLAAIYLRTKTPKTALPLINKALELAPQDPQNWVMLGHYHVLFCMWDKALEVFNQALVFSRNNDLQIQYNIFKVYRSMDDTDKGLKLISFISQAHPEVLTYSWDYAKMLCHVQQDVKALDIYKNLLNRPLHQIPTIMLVEWQKLMVEWDQMDELLQWLKEQSSRHPKNITLKWLYGASCSSAGEHSKAIKLLKEVYSLDPKFLPNLYALIHSCVLYGEKEKALFYIDQYLEQSPENVEVLVLSANFQKIEYGSEVHKKLIAASTSISSISKELQSKIHNALGKINDDTGNYAEAFVHYKKSGAIHSSGKSNSLKELSLLRDTYKDAFNTNLLNSLKNRGYRDKSPVFIVGMPRSGTTLMEKVISSLEGVHGAGELMYMSKALHGLTIGNKKLETSDHLSKADETFSLEERGKYYMERLKAHVPENIHRIIDKMPDNFNFVGPLHLILPEAAIIHSRRHPAEICLSAYRIEFEKGLYWADDLKSLGQYYRIYHEMMEHWKHVLPKGTILEVRYEDMVNDLEGQSKRIAKHIGVEWDPACLEFHNNKKSVKTASALQVNQPLYKSSMNRWKKYEKYLQPLLDEIGDLIEAYETELNSQ